MWRGINISVRIRNIMMLRMVRIVNIRWWEEVRIVNIRWWEEDKIVHLRWWGIVHFRWRGIGIIRRRGIVRILNLYRNSYKLLTYMVNINFAFFLVNFVLYNLVLSLTPETTG